MSTSAPEDQAAGQAESDTGPGGVDPEVLLHELANSTALLPHGPAPEGEDPPEGSIPLPVIEQDGTEYVPVFTSEEALRAAGADASTALRLPLAGLAATWPSEDLRLAVNPATPDGLAIPPEVVRALPDFVHPAGAADGPADQGSEAPQAGADGTPSD